MLTQTSEIFNEKSKKKSKSYSSHSELINFSFKCIKVSRELILSSLVLESTFDVVDVVTFGFDVVTVLFFDFLVTFLVGFLDFVAFVVFLVAFVEVTLAVVVDGFLVVVVCSVV